MMLEQCGSCSKGMLRGHGHTFHPKNVSKSCVLDNRRPAHVRGGVEDASKGLTSGTELVAR